MPNPGFQRQNNIFAGFFKIHFGLKNDFNTCARGGMSSKFFFQAKTEAKLSLPSSKQILSIWAFKIKFKKNDYNFGLPFL